MYPWLQPYYQQIIQAFQQGHQHHALLFKSEKDMGVESLLQHIGAWIMCQQPTQAPCEQCHSCHLRKAESHADIYQLAPLEGKDIGIDQVREINDKVAQHAQQGGNKLVYVYGVESLTEAAANALLKTLEEPRPHTYFLLQADIAAPVLATIYSRCQVQLVSIPDAQQSAEWLIQQTKAEYSAIQTALRISYGKPLLALQVLQQNLLEKRQQFLRQFWLFYRRSSPLELLPFFNSALILHQLDWLLSFLMDSLKCKLGIQENWLCADLAQGIIQFSADLDQQQIFKAVEIIKKLRLDLVQINAVNQELILLDGLTKLITDVFEG